MQTGLAALIFAAVGADASAADAYEAFRAPADPSPLLLAGDDSAWSRAQKIAWGPQEFKTSFRALWNDVGLFIRFDAMDPDPWYTLTQRDARLWEEEVVELFLAGDRSAREYTELQINPANVVCDLRVNPAARKFDVEWNVKGLETQVHMHRGAWIAVAFLPWAGLRASPPTIGDQWAFNVFRIERPRASPERDALLLAWSPTGERSFHVRAAFRGFVFR